MGSVEFAEGDTGGGTAANGARQTSKRAGGRMWRGGLEVPREVLPSVVVAGPGMRPRACVLTDPHAIPFLTNAKKGTSLLDPWHRLTPIRRAAAPRRQLATLYVSIYPFFSLRLHGPSY